MAALPMDMTPVDYAADAAAALYACDMTCVHISHPVKKSLGTLVQENIPGVRIVSSEVFDGMLDAHLTCPEPEKSVFLLGEWVRFNRQHPATITPVNRLTLSALENAGFNRPANRSKDIRRVTITLKKTKGRR